MWAVQMTLVVLVCGMWPVEADLAAEDLVAEFMKAGEADITTLIQKMGGVTEEELERLQEVFDTRSKTSSPDSATGGDLAGLLQGLDMGALGSLLGNGGGGGGGMDMVKGLLGPEGASALEGMDLGAIAQSLGDSSARTALLSKLTQNPTVSKWVSKLGLQDTVERLQQEGGPQEVLQQLMSPQGKAQLGAMAKSFGMDPGMVDQIAGALDGDAVQNLLGGLGSADVASLLQGGGNPGEVMGQLMARMGPKERDMLTRMVMSGGGMGMGAGAVDSLGGFGGAPDPGQRLRQLQQQMTGANTPNMEDMDMTEMMEYLAESEHAHTLLREMGIANIDSDDPEEARRQARIIMSRLSQMMSMGGGMGAKKVVVPDSVLWIVVFIVFATLGGAVYALMNVRHKRANRVRPWKKSRKKRE